MKHFELAEELYGYRAKTLITGPPFTAGNPLKEKPLAF